MGAPIFQSRGPRNNRTRQRVLIVGLAVFVLIDIGLVAFALTATEPSAKAGTVASAPTATPSSSEPVEGSTPAEGAPREATASVVPTRILAALDGSTAWRATTGGCPATSANPELTTDSGFTWESFNASAETGASSILAINVTDTDTTSLVTLDDTNCAPQLVTTFVAGDAWKAYPARVASEWYVNPATPSTVHTPGGDVAAPCAAVSALAAKGAAAAVLCLDASVITTLDAGATWSVPAVVPGAAALAATTEGYAVAVVNSSGCVGASLLSVSAEGGLGAGTDAACLPATVNAGEAAISVAPDGTVWLWAGDALVRSADGGLSWV
jgi:hypothetical protein